MLRKEYLSKFKDHNPFTADLDRQKREDDNFILDSNRPIKEQDIQRLPKEKLEKFVDKVLVNGKLNNILFSTNASAEVKILNTTNLHLKKFKSKVKKKESMPQYNVGKMRENREVIAQAQAMGEQQLEKEYMRHKANEDKIRRMHEKIKLQRDQTDDLYNYSERYKKDRIKKIFEGVQERLEQEKYEKDVEADERLTTENSRNQTLPDIKLNLNNVYSRLYHNVVYLKTSHGFNTARTESNNPQKKQAPKYDFKVKNVIESASGKEFTIKITDDLLMKCFAKHSGGPKLKYVENRSSGEFKMSKLESRFENGQTFLHKAVLQKQRDMVEYLIVKGVNVNIQDDKGNTPLHLAMEIANPNKKIIELLLEAKANLELPNKSNKTPYDLASHEVKKHFGLEHKVNVKR